jgi:hypothetical protein
MQSNQKGLLPEPNPVQIMKSLNNPAMLQVLLQPQLCGRAVKPGKQLSMLIIQNVAMKLILLLYM